MKNAILKILIHVKDLTFFNSDWGARGPKSNGMTFLWSKVYSPFIYPRYQD